MEGLTTGRIAAVVGGALYGDEEVEISGVTVDSRADCVGKMFIALRGEHFDGHDFIRDAVQKKARAVMAERVQEEVGVPFIIVEDSYKALGQLAHWYRRRFPLPVVAITGSCGKTTTKEMVAWVLSGRYSPLKAEKSFNNHIGVPLTLLRLGWGYSVAVLELGMNHRGEIAYLAHIAQPTVGVITNIGPAHIGYLGSIEAIAAEKGELLKNLPAGGVAVLNGDDERVVKLAEGFQGRVIFFGIEGRKGRIMATDIEEREGKVKFYLNRQYLVHLACGGVHNVYNALAAAAVGKIFGVPDYEIAERLSSFKMPPMRGELVEKGGVKIYLDCYNANPLSAQRAIDSFLKVEAERRIAIFGDMKELGEFAREEHKKVGRILAECGFDAVVCVGEFAEFIAEGLEEVGFNGERQVFANAEGCGEWVLEYVKQGDALLIKGSRAVGLEKVYEMIVGKLGRDGG